MNIGNRLRRHPRESIGGRVRVSWVPAGGITQYAMCSAVDISESGMRICCTEPLPVGQYVHFQLEPFGFRGPASVRSCIRSAVRHNIGLEFCNGVRWRPSTTSPDAPKPAA